VKAQIAFFLTVTSTFALLPTTSHGQTNEDIDIILIIYVHRWPSEA